MVFGAFFKSEGRGSSSILGIMGGGITILTVSGSSASSSRTKATDTSEPSRLAECHPLVQHEGTGPKNVRLNLLSNPEAAISAAISPALHPSVSLDLLAMSLFLKAWTLSGNQDERAPALRH